MCETETERLKDVEKNLLDHMKIIFCLFSRAHLFCTYSTAARTTQQKGNRINSSPVPNTLVYCTISVDKEAAEQENGAMIISNVCAF